MDEASFRAFVHARSGALTRTAYLLTGDAHLAEDLLQSALASGPASSERLEGLNLPEKPSNRSLDGTGRPVAAH